MASTPQERRRARREYNRLQQRGGRAFNVGRLSKARQEQWVRAQLGTDYHALNKDEKNQLARWASLARWGLADEEFLEFQDLWYHENPG